MDRFALNPALVWHELTPAAFEEPFTPRLLPVMRHFTTHRSSATATAAVARHSSG
ncbi:hypothetical protein ACP4OV_008876 [Aristida adscensionis]